jgi:DNA-binding CsgD family transcriptional regulator
MSDSSINQESTSNPTDDRSARRLALVEDGVLGVGLLGLAITGLWLARSLRRERELRDEAAGLVLRWQKREQELQAESAALAQQLQVSVLETSHWKHEAGYLLAGLGVAIDAQFERWLLSPAEREVALFLLKGLSHKEIATMRHVGEATVRQQAQGVYRKSGLANRNDLAAFFLEDLLLPSRDAEPTRFNAQ